MNNSKFSLISHPTHSATGDSSSRSGAVKTPSPPKMSSAWMSQTTRRHPFASGQKTSQSLTWSRFGGLTETPECEKKRRMLEKSGLLAKINSLKINQMTCEVDDDDSADREINCIDEVCEVELIEDSFVSHVDSVDSAHPPNVNHCPADDFHSDAPSFVKAICTEASKISCVRDSCWNQRQSQAGGNKPKPKQEEKGATTLARSMFLSQKDKPFLPPSCRPRVLPAWQVKELAVAVGKDKKKNQKSAPSSLAGSKESIASSKSSRSSISSKSSKPIIPSYKPRAEKKRLSVSDGEINAKPCSQDSVVENSTGDKFVTRRSRSQPEMNKKTETLEQQRVKNNQAGAERALGSKINLIQVNDKSYQILNCIGEGGSSKVYQVYDPKMEMTLAVKIVDLSKADQLTTEGYKNEINLLKKLRNCQRVVRMYDYEFKRDTNKLMVVMEKGDSDLAGVLKSFVESENNHLDGHLVRFYWKEMLKAVAEIHRNGIVHADLKPVNFILVGGKLKLIDFGIANAIQENFTSVFKEHQIGTINYMAPEALKNRGDGKRTLIKFNCKADIWSLGCILYNLVYGRTPFHHYPNLLAKATAILDERTAIKYPPIDDPLLLDCMKLCLQRNANKRPSAEDLLKHRYLSDSPPSSQAEGVNIQPSSQHHQLLMTQINNLTPRTVQKLSQVVEKLTHDQRK